MRYTLVVETAISEAALKESLSGFGIKTEYIEMGDQTNRDYFMAIRWHRDDVAEALAEHGIPATEENIDKVIADCGVIEHRSVEEGWEMLDIVIGDIDFADEEAES